MEIPENFEGVERSEPHALALPTPNDPPWNSWVAVGVWIASILAIIFFPAVFLAPYMMSVSGQFASQTELLAFLQTDPTALLLQVLAIIPAHIVTLIIGWFVVTRARKFSFTRTLGWHSGEMRWWHYVAILVGFFAIAGVTGHYVPEQENDFLR